MNNEGSPRIVKLCAATNNSSSEETVASTSTTTDGDVDLPTFESWYRTGISSPQDDTDHTSMVVEASSSSRSIGDLPQLEAVMTNLPNILDPMDPSVSPQGSTTPLLDLVEGSAAAMSRMGVRAKADHSNVPFEGGLIPGKKSKGSSGLELSASSSNQLQALNNLQVELEETRAALELTEEQLTMKMSENDEAADEINKAWKMVSELQNENERRNPVQLDKKNSRLLLHIFQQIELEGGPERAWLSQDGLQAAIVHLYLAREDAVFSKKLSQEQAQGTSKQCQLLQSRLQRLVSGLQGILGNPQDDGDLIFDLEVEGQVVATGGEAAERGELSGSLLEQVRTRLHCQELQAARWQMVTAQLRRELELSRQRCEDKMETLALAQEECRKQKEAAETERRRGREQEESIKALTAKMSVCNKETARSQEIHSELEARINRLSQRLHKTLKEHEENTKCHQKVASLEDEMKIAKATCNELWDQHQDMASRLATKTAELERMMSSSLDMPQSSKVCTSGHHDGQGSDDDHSGPPLDHSVMQDFHEQFDRHLTLADELEAERQKACHLRDERLAHQQAACLTERTELAENRRAYRAGQRRQEMAGQQLEAERRSQEERVKKMTESLLEVTQARGHLTSDLTQAQQEAEVIKRQLVAATTALDYERQTNDAMQVKCDRSEGQAAQLQGQLASLQQDHRTVSQKWAESQRLMASLQAEANQHKQEWERVAAELKQTTNDLQESERRASVAIATSELETNAKLTEWAILNSDLGQRLKAATAERNELTERVQSLEGRQQDYDRRKADLETTKSFCEQLQSQVNQLQIDLAATQLSLQDITSQNQQQELDLDAAQEELNSATNMQAQLRKKLRRQRTGSDSALKSLEEERDILTNQLTEATKNLTNLQQQLKATLDARLCLSDDKQKLTAAYKVLEKQNKLDNNGLQRALYQAESLAQELDEMKKIKNGQQEQLAESATKLVSIETTLKEERSKVTTLSTEVFALRDASRSKKNQIVELTRQNQDLQLELQSANHHNELQYNKLMSSEKTISQLEKTCGSQEEELKHISRENHKLGAELDLLNDALTKKRSDYARALLALHKAEMKDKEVMTVIRQLEGQLDVEKNVQEELNKSCEWQEVELQKLRRTRHDQLDMEQLKNTMESNTKVELQHIKAQLTREIFSKIETSPRRENKDTTDNAMHRMQELEAELSKLKGLRSVDKLTIASLTDDVQKLQKRLAKHKGAMLKHRSNSKPCKDDIQAALAKAHVRALSMSMADSYPAVQSPLFDHAGLFEKRAESAQATPSYGCWDTKSSDSLETCSSDEYSS